MIDTSGQNGILRYGHFCVFFEVKMVKLGLPIDINENDSQNIFEVHIISKNVDKMADFRPKIG